MKINITNNYIKIFVISFIAILLDYFWLINNINTPPGWDQGYHIANTFKMSNIIDNREINIFEKISDILNVTESYRGPLTYFITALILKIFGKSYTMVYLSNNFFNLICNFSIYKISEIYNQKKVGILAIILFTFSPFIFIQRADYLIDLSLTSFGMLFFATLTFWFYSKKDFSKYSLISGITLGLVFLVKPTGIVLFLIPILINFCKRLYLNNKLIFFKELVSFFISFLLVITPWFSRHWLTIISSINNAWQWGIKYQDGLDANTFEGWIYYFKIIPQYLGLPLIIFILIFFILSLLKNKRTKYFGKSSFRNKWLIYLLVNSYIVLSLMSTKETRFLLPVYPVICIYLSLIINKLNNYNFVNENKKIIVVFLLIITFLFNQDSWKIINKSTNMLSKYDNWHHQEIIKTIQKENPRINQTIAVLPDTKEVNTFNLEAEAARQGNKINARQIISNEENFKSDLKYFDWFLLKSGDQGVMNNKAKNLLNYYLLKSNSFFTFRKWNLPDNSELILLRRNKLNTGISEKECFLNTPSLKINQFKNGIKVDLFSKGVYIDKSNLLINLSNKNINKEINLSLLNGRLIDKLSPKNCYYISHILPFKLERKANNNEFDIESYIVTKNNKKILIPDTKLIYSNNSDSLTNDTLYENKISTVRDLGNLIREGNFDKLFYLVGILNQSDPSQVYLKESEKIYTLRYKEDKSLDNLYAILAAQILQKKANDSRNTISKILDEDSKNGNSYLAKAIIEIYQFKLKEAKKSLYTAKSINNKSTQSKSIIKDIDKFIKYI